MDTWEQGKVPSCCLLPRQWLGIHMDCTGLVTTPSIPEGASDMDTNSQVFVSQGASDSQGMHWDGCNSAYVLMP